VCNLRVVHEHQHGRHMWNDTIGVQTPWVNWVPGTAGHRHTSCLTHSQFHTMGCEAWSPQRTGAFAQRCLTASVATTPTHEGLLPARHSVEQKLGTACCCKQPNHNRQSTQLARVTGAQQSCPASTPNLTALFKAARLFLPLSPHRPCNSTLPSQRPRSRTTVTSSYQNTTWVHPQPVKHSAR
jgi:hypothetical protein